MAHSAFTEQISTTLPSAFSWEKAKDREPGSPSGKWPLSVEDRRKARKEEENKGRGKQEKA